MTEHELLQERALRHGLLWDASRSVWLWGGTTVVYESVVDGDWVWCTDGDGVYAPSAPYKSSWAALAGLLQWLDHTNPLKAWRPAPGGVLGEAVRLLQHAAAPVNLHAGDGRHNIMPFGSRESVRQALELIYQVTLPTKHEEGQLLEVAWDYLLSRGGLGESAQLALVAAVRQYPGVVGKAKLAVWIRSESGDLDVLWPLPVPRLTGPDWLAMVYVDGPGWGWDAHPDLDRSPRSVRGLANTREAARDLATKAVSDWIVLASPAMELPVVAGGTIQAPSSAAEIRTDADIQRIARELAAEDARTRCQTCQGRGSLDTGGTWICFTCDGTGRR